MRDLLKLMLVAAAAFALGGCASSGEKEYAGTGKNNLHIQSSVEVARGRAAFLYIYELDAKCERNYLGYIRLEQDKPALEYALQTGKPMVITAEFVLGGSRNSVEYLIQPQPGQDYYADVRFKDRMYKFNLAESHGSARRAVNNAPHGGCAMKN
jgi:hypothetical protein